MKKNMFVIAVVIMLIFTVAALPALQGEVVTVNGKVEYQSGGVWKPLRAGDSIDAGTMVSTGFKSDATIRLGASILTVRPLTRMTLTNLAEKEDVVDTEVYLEVGKVKAEVNSYNNKRNGFSVRSPVATASVRGTVFEMGDRVVVTEGSVEVSTDFGQKRSGKAGQSMDVTDETLDSQVVEKTKEMKTIALSTLPSTETNSPIQPLPTTRTTSSDKKLMPTTTTLVID